MASFTSVMCACRERSRVCTGSTRNAVRKMEASQRVWWRTIAQAGIQQRADGGAYDLEVGDGNRVGLGIWWLREGFGVALEEGEYGLEEAGFVNVVAILIWARSVEASEDGRSRTMVHAYVRGYSQ